MFDEMETLFNLIVSGFIFGLAAGISPGPLLTLVISETLLHSKKEGIKVAAAPVITDLPIIVISIFILSRLSDINIIIGLISLFGGLYILYLAYESITVKSIELDQQTIKAYSLRKGIIANVLNPHPYLFWVLIGAPTIVKAYQINKFLPFSFIIVFYFMLVGSKVFVAVITEKTKSVLNNKFYIYTIRFLGVLLFVFALFLFLDSLKHFNVI